MEAGDSDGLSITNYLIGSSLINMDKRLKSHHPTPLRTSSSHSSPKWFQYSMGNRMIPIVQKGPSLTRIECVAEWTEPTQACDHCPIPLRPN